MKLMLPDIDPNIWASHTFHSSASQLGQIHLGHPTPLDIQHKQGSLRLYVKKKRVVHIFEKYPFRSRYICHILKAVVDIDKYTLIAVVR